MYDIIDKYMKTNLDSRNIALLFSNMLMIIFAIFVAKRLIKEVCKQWDLTQRSYLLAYYRGLLLV